MLIERILELDGATSVQSNTDGITMAIKPEDSDKLNENVAIVTGKQIGRASCRERVSSPV